jgi:glycosyltransferase involved in cell wall biosynthesis
VPDRLPPSLVHALAMLPDHIALRITGYETVGSKGYVKQLTELAGSLGIGHRITYCGTLPLRSQLMAANGSVDIGLAMTPMHSGDANFQGMSGASNKVFDYLACGLAVIVSDLPDWRELFVEPGYGLAVNPQDPESIAAAVGRLAGDAALRLAMGEAGRQRVLAEWNYETLFLPVQKIMTADGKGGEK